ncbi:unnamed protein product [Symbiodinium sp. KB8]|nr:unnamed protein product [Symbiodinium sp. KB8]
MANSAEAAAAKAAAIESGEASPKERFAVTTAKEVWEQRGLPADSPLLPYMDDSQWLHATEPILRELVDQWLQAWEVSMQKSISDNLCMRSLARRLRSEPKFQSGRPSRILRCCDTVACLCYHLVIGVVLHFIVLFIFILLAVLLELFLYPALFICKYLPSGQRGPCMKECDPGVLGFVMFVGLGYEPSVFQYVSELLYKPEMAERMNRSLHDMNVGCYIDIGHCWQKGEDGRDSHDECWAWYLR